MKIYLLGLALILMAACGAEETDDSNKIAAPIPFSEVAPVGSSALTEGSLQQHMIFSSDIPAEQQAILRSNLALIDNWNGTMSAEAAARVTSLLGLHAATRDELQLWLKQRLKFLLGSDLKSYYLGLVFQGSGEVGIQTLDLSTKKDEENTGASNIGTALYMQTLKEQQSRPELAYLILQVNDSWVPILTPRAGVMQIGPALFNPAFQVNGANLGATSNSLQNIEVLYHEARHSDGNSSARSLGFPHVNCPNSEDIPKELRGQAACDDALNGAYSVGAAVLRGLTSLCNRVCTTKEVGVLQSIYLDRLSRVLVNEQNGQNRDPSEESAFPAIDFSSFQAIRLH